MSCLPCPQCPLCSNDLPELQGGPQILAIWGLEEEGFRLTCKARNPGPDQLCPPGHPAPTSQAPAPSSPSCDVGQWLLQGTELVQGPTHIHTLHQPPWTLCLAPTHSVFICHSPTHHYDHPRSSATKASIRIFPKAKPGPQPMPPSTRHTSLPCVCPEQPGLPEYSRQHHPTTVAGPPRSLQVEYLRNF